MERRAVPATTATAVEDDVSHDQVLSWYAGALAELDAVVGGATGVPGGLYDDALSEDGRGHLLAYRPTADPPHSGRVHPVTLPAVEPAVTSAGTSSSPGPQGADRGRSTYRRSCPALLAF